MTVAFSAELDTAAAVELMPGRFYTLGAAVPLDGRISWVPAAARGFQASNAHLLLENGAALLYETGVAAVGPAVLRQLEALLPPGSALTLIVSRPEFDCSGSVEELARRYRLSGGGAYDFTRVGLRNLRFESRSGQLEPGVTIELAPGRRVVAVPPALRMLLTHWLYDEVTRTLCTADAFTHVYGATPAASRVERSSLAPRVEDVAAALLAKFWWLRHLRSPHVGDSLERLFAAHQIEAIAPSCGAVILGRDAVAAHFGAVVAAIRGFEAGRWS